MNTNTSTLPSNTSKAILPSNGTLSSNTSITILPSLVIFVLDYTLLPFHADYHKSPFTKLTNGSITDKNGTIIKFFDEIPAVFEKLKDTNITTAIVERVSNETHHTTELLEMLGWNKYVTFLELETNDTIYFDIIIDKLHEKSKIPYDKMILFHNRYLYIELDDLRKKGVFFKPTSVDGAMTVQVLEEGLKEYSESKQPKKEKKTKSKKKSERPEKEKSTSKQKTEPEEEKSTTLKQSEEEKLSTPKQPEKEKLSKPKQPEKEKLSKPKPPEKKISSVSKQPNKEQSPKSKKSSKKIKPSTTTQPTLF